MAGCSLNGKAIISADLPMAMTASSTPFPQNIHGINYKVWIPNHANYAPPSEVLTLPQNGGKLARELCLEGLAKLIWF